MVGVLSFVMWSVFEIPVSLAASKSGAEEAVGAAVSTVTERTGDGSLTLPAGSTARAV
jgi:hypothetical protein